MIDFAANVRRIMARGGMTIEQVVAASGLHQRTVRAILNGQQKPHARTLHRLAAGLGVLADELFQPPAALAHRSFDRHTNPVVDELLASQPELFEGWTSDQFAELYSRFGTGGALTSQGTLHAVRAMNQKRDVHQKVSLLLESDKADLLVGLVDLLYQEIVISSG